MENKLEVLETVSDMTKVHSLSLLQRREEIDESPDRRREVCTIILYYFQ